MVTNLPQFKAYSNKLKKEVEQIAWKRSEEAGGMAEQTAKAITKTLTVQANGKTYRLHDNGHHARNIGHRKSEDGNIGSVVYANADYAAYLEFGTGGLVDVPSGWEEVAIQFIGQGIKEVNLVARPHLIPAGNKAFVFMEKQIAKDIAKL